MRTNCFSADTPSNSFENDEAAVTNSEANVYRGTDF